MVLRKKSSYMILRNTYHYFIYTLHYLELNICNMPGTVLSSFIKYCGFTDELRKWLNGIIVNTWLFSIPVVGVFFVGGWLTCVSVSGWVWLLLLNVLLLYKGSSCEYICQLMLFYIIFDSCLASIIRLCQKWCNCLPTCELLGTNLWFCFFSKYCAHSFAHCYISVQGHVYVIIMEYGTCSI